MNAKATGPSFSKNVVTMKPFDISETLDELRDLKKEMNEMKGRMKSQSLDIQYIKDVVDKMSEQVALLAPRKLKVHHFPIKTQEALFEMHRRITAEKDAKFATQIFSEVRMIIKNNGGINSDLKGCFESILDRDLCCEVNWNGYHQKKALNDHWLFKFCLPKILEVDPEDPLEMKHYESRVVMAVVAVQHRRLAQHRRKREKDSSQQPAKKKKESSTDPLESEEFLDDSRDDFSDDDESITGV